MKLTWMFGVQVLGAASAISLTPAIVAAQDGKQAFCVDYANEAVEMQRRNIALGCGIEGIRWHEWWDSHYGWCKDWVSPKDVHYHTELRRTEIAQCRGDGEQRSSGRSRY